MSDAENPITSDYFFSVLPEFANGDYSASQVNFWIEQAYNSINVDRLGKNTDLAVCFWVAHQLVLWKRLAGNPAATNANAMITNKSVGGVSVGYDNNAAIVQGAENYNLSSYGQRFWRLLRAASTTMYVRNSQPPARWPW